MKYTRKPPSPTTQTLILIPIPSAMDDWDYEFYRQTGKWVPRVGVELDRWQGMYPSPDWVAVEATPDAL